MDKDLLKNLIFEAQKIISEGQKCTFVFDLDSTIFCVGPRTQKILRDLGNDKEVQNRYPDAAKILQIVNVLPTDWGIRTALKRHNVKETIEFFEYARSVWIKEFFASKYLTLDTPYPGTIEFVQMAHKEGVKIKYLTGRDRVRMEEGTLKAFELHGLPLDNPEDLNMKPDSTHDDTEYKVEFFKSFKDDLSKTWFFENEPFIIEKVRAEIKDLNIVFSDTVHSGRATPPKDLPSLGFEWPITRS